MPLVSSLQTNITANNKQFIQAFNQAEAKVGSFGSQLGKMSSLLKGAFAGLSVASVIKGLASIANEASRLADEADKLGITVAHLQELSLVAGEAGLSQEGLSNTIFKLNKLLGEASIGTKEASDNLAILGLTSNDFSGLDVEQKLTKMGEALSSIEDSSLRDAVAFKYFGRSAKEAMAFFKSDIKTGTDAAKDLNFTLNDLQKANLDRLSESFARFWTVSKGKVGQFLADMVPEIERLGSILLKISESAAGALMKGLKTWASGIRDGIEVLKQVTYDQDVKGVAGFLQKFNNATGGSISGLSDQGNDVLTGKNGLLSESSTSSIPSFKDGSMRQLKSSSDDYIRTQMTLTAVTEGAVKGLDNFKNILASIQAPRVPTITAGFQGQGQDQASRILSDAIAKSARPLAQSAEFESILTNIINRKNNPKNFFSEEPTGSDPTQQKLKQLESIITGNDKLGMDTTGLKSALDQLNQYLTSKISGDSAAKVDLSVSVEASPDFIMKVTSSQDFKQAQKKAIYEEWSKAARSLGVR